jgi:hypothetical protein
VDPEVVLADLVKAFLGGGDYGRVETREFYEQEAETVIA